MNRLALSLAHHCRRATTTSTAVPSAVASASRAFSTQGTDKLSVTDGPENVKIVSLNRPEQANALDHDLWMAIGDTFTSLAEDTSCRAIVLRGEGKHFCSGIDVGSFQQLFLAPGSKEDFGRRTVRIRNLIKAYQASFTAVAASRVPVIASIHSACIGGAVDLIAATDIRVCTEDAFFAIKEVDLGLAADVGTLQRLPKLIGNDSIFRELAFTGRNFGAAEAERFGMVSSVHSSRDACDQQALDLAANIAAKSPIAVTGTKVSLDFARDHTVEEGLDQIASWNAAMLQSSDLMTAAKAAMTKQPAKFAGLE